MSNRSKKQSHDVNSEAGGSPDWGGWRQIPKAMLWEVVALSCNLDPEKRKGFLEHFDSDDLFHPHPPEFKQRLKIAIANIGDGIDAIEECRRECDCRVRLQQFATWAIGMGWGLPDEFPRERDTGNRQISCAEEPPTPGQAASEAPAGSAGTWQEQARQIADECFDRDTANNCRDSLAGYASRVMDEMQKRGIHGPRGRIDNANTIQREALQGAKWWANKKP